MSSSGVTNYSVTELEVIEGALSKIGVLQDGQATEAADVVKCRRNLNMIVKQWVAQTDFAPGLKMWTRRRAYLFLQDGQTVYDVGPSGNECASETYVHTTVVGPLSGVAATLTDATGIAIADRIAFEQEDGSLVWTTVSSVSGNVVHVPITVTAADGAVVFAYTSKPYKPFEIVSASMRDTNDQDVPMDPFLSLEEYELIPSKQALGTPSRIYFEARKTGGRLYLDRSPEDVSKVIRIVFHSYIEDTSAQSQDVDFPAEWFRALVAQLAIDSAIDFGRPITQELKDFRDESLKMAKNAHPDTSTAFYESDPDSYE